MREKITNSSKDPEEYFKEIEFRKKQGKLPIELRDRFQMCEGRGKIGWEKLPEDTSFFIWDKIPDAEAVSIADELARSFGSKEAYFELYEVAFGGAGEWFLTWVLEKTIEWAGGKGLDYIYKRLRDPKTINLAEELKKRSAFEDKDGKLFITITPDNEQLFHEVIVEIVGYPERTKSISLDSIEELKSNILEGKSKRYIYTKDGVFKEGQCPGRHISIDI